MRQQPDLVIEDLLVIPTTIPPGGEARVSFMIANRGSGSADAARHRIRVLKPDTLVDILLDTVMTPMLAAGEDWFFSRMVTLPSALPSGPAVIRVIADVDDEVKESDEGNNRAIVPIQVP
ncbi:MAG: hypothetical protein HY650_06455 [Acidobacteria bacterium]|nr:hypothetical protein [Acidobacteriota bacterium]